MSTITKTARGLAAAPSIAPLKRSDLDFLNDVRHARDGLMSPDLVYRALAELVTRNKVDYRPELDAADPLAAWVLDIHADGGVLLDNGGLALGAAWSARETHNAVASEYRGSLLASGMDPELAPPVYGTGTHDRDVELEALGVRWWRWLYFTTTGPVASVCAALAEGGDVLETACEQFLVDTGDGE